MAYCKQEISLQCRSFHNRCWVQVPRNIARLHRLILFGFADYNPTRIIPSSKAFLFSLSPFNTNDGRKKLQVLPEKRHQAIRSTILKGPCWGEDKNELCLDDQQVNTEIDGSGVYNVSGISNPSTYFTGESSFQADDVEVLTIGGRTEMDVDIIGDDVNFLLNYRYTCETKKMPTNM